LTLYLYTFSLYENASLIIFSAETEYISTRYWYRNICEIACRAYSKALSAENIRHAFRRTGIFPLERTSINSDYLVPAQIFTCLENIPGKGKKN
jgi:hypothetical protein